MAHKTRQNTRRYTGNRIAELDADGGIAKIYDDPYEVSRQLNEEGYVVCAPIVVDRAKKHKTLCGRLYKILTTGDYETTSNNIPDDHANTINE